MPKTYSIHVSDLEGPPVGQLETERHAASWTCKYDGPIATRAEAIQAAQQFGEWFPRVRLFYGGTVGRCIWEVNQHHDGASEHIEQEPGHLGHKGGECARCDAADARIEALDATP